MDHYQRRRIEQLNQALRPQQMQAILGAVNANVLDEVQVFVMAVTQLATGLRTTDLLTMGIPAAVDLPGTIQPLVQQYAAAVKQVNPQQHSHFLFPNLLWLVVGRELAVSRQSYLVDLQRLAERAGVDPSQIRWGTMRQTAATLRAAPGGFEAFFATLPVPTRMPGSHPRGRSAGWGTNGI